MKEALSVARKMMPDILLMGLHQPFLSTLDIVHNMSANTATATVVVCDIDDAGWAVEALWAGAAAFVFTGAEPEDVFRALRTAVVR